METEPVIKESDSLREPSRNGKTNFWAAIADLWSRRTRQRELCNCLSPYDTRAYIHCNGESSLRRIHWEDTYLLIFAEISTSLVR